MVCGGVLAACLILVVTGSPQTGWLDGPDAPDASEGARATISGDAELAEQIAAEKPANGARPAQLSGKGLLTAARYEFLERCFRNGEIDDPERLYEWSLRMLNQESAVTRETGMQPALRAHFERMQRLEELVGQNDVLSHKTSAAVYRLEAEMMQALGEAKPVDEW
jgi:hypothetical protein